MNSLLEKPETNEDEQHRTTNNLLVILQKTANKKLLIPFNSRNKINNEIQWTLQSIWTETVNIPRGTTEWHRFTNRGRSFLAISLTSGVKSFISKWKTWSPYVRLGISSRSDRRISLTGNVMSKLESRITGTNPPAVCNWDVGWTNRDAVCPGKQHLRLDHGRLFIH